ncbi:MAG: DUF4043 family protein [Thermodesulfovibrionales bacterium]|nr:DUF4043 family protein [Thermodesulfovibrionales bacterium]
MTASAFATADPRTQTMWSTKVFKYALQNMGLTMMMGDTDDALIQVDNGLEKRKGVTIIFESSSPMSGAGQGDDGNTTGKEEGLKRRNMSLVVHERAHSYVSAGKISEQRTSTNVREDGKKDLGSWFAEALENDLITAAYGGYNENSSGSAIETINEAYPSSDRINYGGQTLAGVLENSGTYTTDALLTAGTTSQNYMGTLLLEKIRRKCMAATPRFRRVKIYDLSKYNQDDARGGIVGPLVGRYLIAFLNPLQIKSIKAESGTIGWKAMVAAADRHGNQNPMFSGASFLWDGVLCYEYDRIPTRTGAGGTTLAEGYLLDTARAITSDPVASGDIVARALMMGAQALCFGWAQKLEWSEDYVDNNKPKVKVDSIYGVKRTQFNAHGTSTAGSTEAIYCMDTEVLSD